MPFQREFAEKFQHHRDLRNAENEQARVTRVKISRVEKRRAAGAQGRQEEERRGEERSEGEKRKETGEEGKKETRNKKKEKGERK